MGFLKSLTTFVIHAIEFIFYRTFHMWQGAGRALRALIPPGGERKAVLVGFALRYVAVVGSVWLTLLTIQADLDDDDDRVRLLILWGLIPSTLRTLAAMWTSTIDRQMAKDLQIQANTLVPMLNTMRSAVGHPLDEWGKFKQFRLRAKNAVGRTRKDTEVFPLDRPVRLKAPLLRQYVFLAKTIEIPLNYIIQKALVALIIFFFLFPDVFGRQFARDVSVVSRYARIATTLLLAPLNQYLGVLRLAAYRQQEQAFLDEAERCLPLLSDIADSLDADASDEADRMRVAAVVHLAQVMERRVQARVDATHAQSSRIIRFSGDDRDTDALLRTMWRIHHRYKLNYAAVQSWKSRLAHNPGWRQLEVRVEGWGITPDDIPPYLVDELLGSESESDLEEGCTRDESTTTNTASTAASTTASLSLSSSDSLESADLLSV